MNDTAALVTTSIKKRFKGGKPVLDGVALSLSSMSPMRAFKATFEHSPLQAWLNAILRPAFRLITIGLVVLALLANNVGEPAVLSLSVSLQLLAPGSAAMVLMAAMPLSVRAAVALEVKKQGWA